MARTGRDHGVPLSVVETTIAANDHQKERMVRKISEGMGGVKGRTIAVLGLSFKPNTDDVREAPALTICEGLASEGARLRVWDPAGMEEAAWRLEHIRGKLLFAQDEYDALEGADALVIVTEWNQFRNLDLDRVKSLLKSPLFFDLRNIYSPQDVEAKGFKYFGVGR
jgi:UDPglucose 6-dehydrogenase